MLKKEVERIYEQLFLDYPALDTCRKDLMDAFILMKECYNHGGKVLICGNGGSASDAEHIVGELMKGFLLKRAPGSEVEEKFRTLFPEDGEYLASHLQGALPAISLVSQTAISTAFINDVAADMVYAQQVYGYAKPGDLLIGISTSGNARNVCNAVKVARVLGAATIGMTGEDGGQLKNFCDITIRVPSRETYRVQEYHLPVYHALCAMIEAEFFE